MPTWVTLQIAAEREKLGEVRRFVVDTLAAWGVASGVIDKLRLAVDEAAANVIVHGYLDRGGDLEIRLRHSPEAVTVVIRDHAPPFDPTAVACPPPGVGMLGSPPGGLGLTLIREAVDALQYCIAADGANELTMVKALGEGAASRMLD
jgi:anti-sigma regulatory factor (Ser/Thr protein kinase)